MSSVCLIVFFSFRWDQSFGEVVESERATTHSSSRKKGGFYG